MIRELKWKFIRISMMVISMVVLLLMGTTNVVHRIGIEKSADEKLDLLEANAGMLPSTKNSVAGWLGHEIYPQDHEDDETLYELRYYTVILDENGKMVSVDLRRSATQTKRNAVEIAQNLWKEKRKSGYVGCCKYRAVPIGEQTMYIFLNCHREIMESRKFLFNSFWICLVGLGMIFLLLYLLSGRAIKPFVDNFEKQKRFITDASHEMKTPLAIISANAEVLEMVDGENEWTQSIQKQIQRMNHLTEEMVMLSRLDEENVKRQMEDCNLSDLVREVVNNFRTLAESQNKELYLETDEEIVYCGEEMSLRQLFFILLDNAVKYALPETRIECRLTGSTHPVFVIRNQAEGLLPGKQDRLFERFYRLDVSRNSETGGNGIGLSIAKAIVEAHKGKITAFSRDGKEICFTICF